MPGNNTPLVSVIMPFYNGQRYMTQAVQTVLDQTYKNIEIVVVDDASPNKDESLFIKKLSKKYAFTLVSNTSNKGIGQTLADAVSASKGEFIAELSQDDLYKPEKIEEQMKMLMSKNLDAVYAIGDILYEGSDQRVQRDTEKISTIINSGKAAELLKQKNLSGISLQGLLARQSVVREAIIPIWRDYLLDDWPVNIRLFENYRVGFIDKPLWTCRLHSQSTSRDVWKQLGPQIEVIARMTPEQFRIEGIGNRLASLARRLLKQKYDPDTIIRLAAAGLVLTQSGGHHKKVSGILNKLPSQLKKQIMMNKLNLIDDAMKSENNIVIPKKPGNINWNTIGKDITSEIRNNSEEERLNRIASCFHSLAIDVLSVPQTLNHAGSSLLLASLVLTENSENESEIIHVLKSIQQDDNDLIRKKYRLLKRKINRSARYLWLN